MLIRKFEEQVRRTPGNIALKIDDTILTYEQLNRLANAIAGRILEIIPPQTGFKAVGLLLDHGMDMIAAILGVLKSGNLYVPLSPDYPFNRMAYMLSDSEAVMLITSKGYQETARRLSADTNVTCFFMEDVDTSIALPEFVKVVKPNTPAYILYTSGSTGRPKGVVQTHENAYYYVRNWIERFTITANDRMTLFSSFCHDGSVQDLFSALLSGATLYPNNMRNRREARQTMEISEFLNIEKITIWHSVPSLYSFFVNSLEETDSFPHLRFILLGGEPIRSHDIRMFKSRFPTSVLANVYGQTESSVNTIWMIRPNDRVNKMLIGSPLDKTGIFVIGENGQPVSPLETGEIMVACPHLSLGYWKNEPASRKAFSMDPEFGKLYWTGDLGRLLINGDIEFIGRRDSQVKIRGYRVELGEIESQLLKHDGIKEAIVMARTGQDDDRYLAAYFLGVQNQPVSTTQLREFLASELPDYMIPSYFIALDQFPLTQSGKIDRNALPEPFAQVNDRDKYTAPRNELEEKLVHLWGRVLGLELKQIGIDSNFFELGGHSLRATSLLAAMHKELNVKIPLAMIFNNGTIRELAHYIGTSEHDRYTPVVPVEKKEYYPLSSAQQRLYILHQIEPANTGYNMSRVVRLSGKPDFNRFQDTFRLLGVRHESLRTSFFMIEREPVQRIHDALDFTIELHSLSGGELQTSAANKINQLIRPFDLSVAPLFRAAFIILSQDECVLVLDLHHIISDGTSMDVLFRESLQLYEKEQLVPLRIQYTDFAAWQGKEKGKESLVRQEAYWIDQLSGELPALELPFDYPRPLVQDFSGKRFQFSLGETVATELKNLAQRHNATLYQVLLTVYYVLLFRLGNNEDIIVGAPTAGRSHADVENVIGMFVNTLALRAYPAVELPFPVFLEQVKKQSLDAFENQDYQFEALVGKLDIKRDPGRNPLFDVVFILQNMERSVIRIPGISIEPFEYENPTSKFDVSLVGLESGQDVFFTMEYKTGLFSQESIARFVNYYKSITSAIIKDQSLCLGQIEIISVEEKQLVLEQFNCTGSPVPLNKRIEQLFEEQVERTPDRVALIGPPHTYRHYLQGDDLKVPQDPVIVSYGELDKRAGGLASLLSEKGLVPQTIVALILPRGLDIIMTVLGVLKAGGVYLPVNPEYPQERIDYILKDSNSLLWISYAEESERKAINPGAFQQLSIVNDHRINLPGKKLSYPGNSGIGNRFSSENASPLGYVIYTSGTTGRPRGVLVGHGSLVNLCYWHNQYYRVTEVDRATQFSDMGFDASVWELFPYLIAGASLSIVEEEIKPNPLLLKELFERNQISISFLPTLMCEEFMKLGPVNSGLRALLTGGEKLKSVAPTKYTLYNNYGPTENTVVSTSFPVQGQVENIPIGKPISNQYILILWGEYRQIQPPGLPGEICLGGIGLARGYLNRPELTAEKFETNFPNQWFNTNKMLLPGVQGDGFLEKSPPGSNGKIYKTGDLARWDWYGNIEFLGRIDHQVKLRGFRIELGEIEARLLGCPLVKETAVLMVEHGDDHHLCAYVVAASSEHQELPDEKLESQLRQYLVSRIPGYMIPSYFILLDKLPVNASGKLDRNALPTPNIIGSSSYAAPQTEIESQLAGIWADILGIDESQPVSIDADFFELGGHSLKATVLTTRIHKLFGIKMPLVEVFKTPTIRGMAQYLKNADRVGYVPIHAAEKREYYPLSSAQSRFYILQQVTPDGTAYNMPTITEVKGELSEEKIRRVLQEIIRRHSVLRTSFQLIQKSPVQKINDTVQLSPQYEEASGVQDKIKSFIRDFIRPFDLSVAPLLRLGLMKLNANRHLLMFDMHHIISDGSSVSVFLREFSQLYAGQEMAPLRLQYRDFALWQYERLGSGKLITQETYWLDRFQGELPVLNMPLDFARPPVQDFDGDRYYFNMDLVSAGEVKGLARESGTTLFMVLLAVFTITLSRYSNQEDIVIGTTIAGRPHTDLQHMMGLLLETLALRNFPNSGLSFARFLEEVKHSTLAAYENQDYPFKELIKRLGAENELSRNPVFDVMLIVQNLDMGTFELEGLGFSPFRGTGEPAHYMSKVDITLEAAEFAEGISFRLEYCTGLYERDSIERLARHFLTILSEVAANPVVRLADIRMTGVEERVQLLEQFNHGSREWVSIGNVRDLFVDRVRRNPDSIAILSSQPLLKPGNKRDDSPPVAEMIQVSYRELDHASDRLAMVLKSKGVQRDSIVALNVEPSLEMVTGLWGIIKSGGAYLPIDTNTPDDRVEYILMDSCSSLILNTSDINAFSSQQAFADDPECIASSRDFSLESESSLAYIIYTSGTTGRPKGVLVMHRNLSAYLSAFNREFRLSPDDIVVQQISYAFDAFVEELYPILLAGGLLAIPGKEVSRDITGLCNFIVKHWVTFITCSPQLLNELNRFPQYLSSLRIMISGGDRLKAEYITNISNTGNVYNTYGPTESTVCATYYRCPADGELPSNVPIGKPIYGYRVLILDGYGNLLPVGIGGELCVSGPGVARGYLNQPELTAEKFSFQWATTLFNSAVVPVGNSANPSQRADNSDVVSNSHSTTLPLNHSTIYRTGDLSRWLPEGNIEFLGRIDRQVKVRGYRIELSEIEYCLLAMGKIKEAIVIEGHRGSGQNYLTAYVLCSEPLDMKVLRDTLALQLPGYMVPSYFVQLEVLPLTSSGKVDYKRLPSPERRSGASFSTPQSSIEKTIAKIWQEVLEINRVGPEDNFFDLGGTSLDIFNVNTRLNETFNTQIPVVVLFQHSTVRSLSQYLENVVNQGNSREVEEVQKGSPIAGSHRITNPEMAVIGIAGRFPGARDTDEFWENLQNGIEGIAFFSDEELLAEGVDTDSLNHPQYIKARGIVENAEYFDAAFFGYTPKEAQIMDPQIRVFTQCVWHALEDAGYDPFAYKHRIGLYAGASPNLQWEAVTAFSSISGGINSFMTMQLVDKDFMCTHVSYKLNLRGPSFSVQTACSTSLSAVHWAVQGLLLGECEMAVAGGVSINYPIKRGYRFRQGMIYAADGHNRTFDNDATGSVFGDGAGVVVLKPLTAALADNDYIYAIIKGTAANNDGLRKVGYTAPSVEGQANVIQAAQIAAGVEPESISYIEAHGTATPLGDTVEIEALKQAFGSNKKGFCALGTVKSNVGHLYSAAGAAGLIKTLLALKNRLIPPTLHVNTVNPRFNLNETPFYINRNRKAWTNEQYPLRAGVSAFGIGGTNVHIVLEEAPPDRGVITGNVILNRDYPQNTKFPAEAKTDAAIRSYQLILLSAKTPGALDRQTGNLLKYLELHPGLNLADMAYTLQVGRKHFPYRRMLLCPTDGDSLQQLAVFIKRLPTALVKEENPPVVFLFCGQGSQYVNMGKDLYMGEPLFRQEMDRCFELLKPLIGYDIKEILYPDLGALESGIVTGNQPDIHQTEMTQPVVFAFEYALAKLLISWGIKPWAMLGYSFGEYIAACISGVLSLEDALKVITLRGKLAQQTPEGAMTSVPMRENDLLPLLNKDVSLAIVNGPTCIVSGTKVAIEFFEQEMKSKRIICVPLNMSQAVHSHLMEPIRQQFEKHMGNIRLNAPQIPYISNVTAQWISAQETRNPAYWGDHLCRTVRFSDGLKELLKQENALFIEIGAGRILGMMVRTHPDKKPGHVVLNTVKHQQEKTADDYFLLDKLGQLWLHGQQVDWNGFHGDWSGKRIPLPKYPFEGKRYGLDRNSLIPMQPAGGVSSVPSSLLNSEEEEALQESVPQGTDGNEKKGTENGQSLPPQTQLEQEIARLWQELLGMERIGIDDDFFFLNGSSLLATQIILNLGDRFQVDIPINRFYEKPTIAHLAEIIEDLKRNK